MKKLLLALLVLVSPAFADFDDIFIITPYEGEVVNGTFTLQVQDPWGKPDSIQAVMKLDVDRGPDRLVWRGLLKASDNYAIQIDTSRFPPGEYEIDVRYTSQGRVFSEDVEFYITAKNQPQ